MDDKWKDSMDDYNVMLVTIGRSSTENGTYLPGVDGVDVKGFIEHNGKDFLYQGYWKVYENVEERKKMFSIYNVVKEEFIREMQAGKDLWHAARSVRQPFDIQPA